MVALPLLAVALLWPAMLSWLVAALVPIVLAWWAVRHARRVGWGAIDLIMRAARAARITRSGLPLPLTLVRVLLIATTVLAATRPFLEGDVSPRGARVVSGEPRLRIELVTTEPSADSSSLAMLRAIEALGRTRLESSPTVDLVPLAQAGRAADPPRLMILCDGVVPVGGDATRLDEAIRGGTSIIICLGPAAVAAPLLPRVSAWLERLVGISVFGSVPLDDEAIVTTEPEGAGRDGVAAPMSGPRVSCAAELFFSDAAPRSPTVLARSALTGRPLLVESAAGRGRVMVSAVPLALPQVADTQAPWSDLAAWPAFVPFVDRLVTRALGPAEQTGDSRARPAAWFAGLPLARPLLACGCLLALIEAILAWRRLHAAGFPLSSASLGSRGVMLAALAAMVALWGGRPAEGPTRPQTPPPVAVVLDVSPSMGSVDLPPESRFRRLIEATTGGEFGRSVFDRLARDRPVIIHAVAGEMRRLGRYSADVSADDLRRLDATLPAAAASRVGDAVLDLIEKQEADAPAAVIVMSDGAITGGASWAAVADAAARRGVPLIAVPVGDDAKPSADLPTGFRFTAAAAPTVCQIGERITIPVRGMASTGSALPLMLSGEEGKASLVADPSPHASGYGYAGDAGISLPDASTTTVTRTLTLAVTSDEARHEATVPIIMADDPIRVLLVDRGPRYEVRFLERLLASDSQYAVTKSLLKARDGATQGAKATLPQSVEAWNEFDVVVLGDLPVAAAEDNAVAWEALREAVTNEGVGIAWLPGRQWAEADAGMNGWLPAAPDLERSPQVMTTLPRRLRVLSAGTAKGWVPSLQAVDDSVAPFSPLTFSTLPPLVIQPTARVIAMTATDSGVDLQPAIVISQVGRGTVVGHLCDTWRWRSGHGSSDVVDHARYWRHLLPRLAERRRLTRLVAAQVVVRPLDPMVGETIRIDVMPTRPATALAGWTLEVESPLQPSRPLEIASGAPGSVTTLRVDGLAAGRHRLRLVAPAETVDLPATEIHREIVVNDWPVERADGPAGTGPLQAAVRMVAGTVVPLDRIQTLPDTIASVIDVRRDRGGRSRHWLESQGAAHLMLAIFVVACLAAWWPRLNPVSAVGAR